MAVDDDDTPISFVLVEGTVTVSEDLDELLRWATAIGGRYMGTDRAEEFGRRNGVPGEYLVRIHPTRIVAGRASPTDHYSPSIRLGVLVEFAQHDVGQPTAGRLNRALLDPCLCQLAKLFDVPGRTEYSDLDCGSGPALLPRSLPQLCNLVRHRIPHRRSASNRRRTR